MSLFEWWHSCERKPSPQISRILLNNLLTNIKYHTFQGCELRFRKCIDGKSSEVWGGEWPRVAPWHTPIPPPSNLIMQANIYTDTYTRIHGIRINQRNSPIQQCHHKSSEYSWFVHAPISSYGSCQSFTCHALSHHATVSFCLSVFLLLLYAYTYIEVYVCLLTSLAIFLLCTRACVWTITHRRRTCAEYAA